MKKKPLCLVNNLSCYDIGTTNDAGDSLVIYDFGEGEEKKLISSDRRRLQFLHGELERNPPPKGVYPVLYIMDMKPVVRGYHFVENLAYELGPDPTEEDPLKMEWVPSENLLIEENSRLIQAYYIT
jgi:hypothetical protein